MYGTTPPPPPRRPGPENAILPARRFDSAVKVKKPIGQMAVGERGYAVPWAAIVDTEDRLWIDPSKNVYPVSKGTKVMEVCRGESGFIVYIMQTDYRWTHKTRNTEGLLPIIEFVD